MNQYSKTIKFCYMGYIVQAVVNNLLPLCFVIFKKQFSISIESLGSLVLVNFTIQLVVDYLASRFGDKLGYRKAMVLAHFTAAAGLLMVAVLPHIIPNTFLALSIATLFFASGSGLIEVMVSPLIDAAISESKSSAMSLLHSFYCWGQVVVVLLSTIFIKIFGEQYWYILPALWAILPFLNAFPFLKLPLPQMLPEEQRVPLKKLFKNKLFLVLIMLMVCAGAFELSMSQWASFFAERGLGVSKMAGDLLGPCAFAVFMGISRTIYGVYGEHMPIKQVMLFSALLGIVCYSLAGLCGNPYIALLGCSVCGFSVGIMWPGTLSLAGDSFKGGTAMFGMLALAGDLGCSIGPWLTGMVSGLAEKSSGWLSWGAKYGFSAEQTGIKIGVLTGIIFPILTVIFVLLMKNPDKAKNKE